MSTVSSGMWRKNLLTFPRNVLYPSSGLKSIPSKKQATPACCVHGLLFGPENGGSIFLENVEIHSKKNHNDRRENFKSHTKIYKRCSSQQLTFYDSTMSRLWENLKFIWTSCKIRVTDLLNWYKPKLTRRTTSKLTEGRSKLTAIKRYDGWNSTWGNILQESIIMYAHAAKHSHFEVCFVNVKFLHVKYCFGDSGQ